MQKSILVPIDFTEVTENALKVSLNLASSLQASLALLNIVSSEKDKERSMNLLQTLAEKYKDNHIQIHSYSEVGDISDIGTIAKKLGATLIVMGTHGLKGIQYLIGSKALKVIANSKVPFIVTQAPPKSESIAKIVVPMLFVSEEKAVLGAISELARALNAKLLIFGAAYNDELLDQKVKLNISFAKRYLKEKNLDFSVNEAPGKKDFEDEVLDFSKMIDADMIALVNHHEDGYKNLFGKNFDQNIITNSLKVPVFIFTSKQVNDLRDIFMITG